MIVWPVVEQHAEKAAFLWLLRDRAVGAPHYDLAALAELDERIDAHLDGLRVAGSDVVGLCLAPLHEKPDGGEVFVATVAACELGGEEAFATVLGASSERHDLARGFVSALAWMPPSRAVPLTDWLFAAGAAQLRYLGLAARAALRAQTDGLDGAFAEGDTRLRARALRAVGELGRLDLLGALQRIGARENEDCGFWSAWSRVLLGDDGGADTLRALTHARGHHAEAACAMAARAMPVPDACAWLNALLRSPEDVRAALRGIAAVGAPVLVPELLARLDDDGHARVAAEALTHITGVDLAAEGLRARAPKRSPRGPNDDPADPRVALDPDHGLPWPDPSATRRWWNAHAEAFAPTTRHLAGRPLTPTWARAVLRSGAQRLRAAAAIELARARPGGPLFEVRMPGYRQGPLLEEG